MEKETEEEKEMIAKKNLQVVLVVLLFSSLLIFLVLPSILPLSIINQEHVITTVGSASITTGDILIVFTLFATTVTVVVWLSNYQRRR